MTADNARQRASETPEDARRRAVIEALLHLAVDHAQDACCQRPKTGEVHEAACPIGRANAYLANSNSRPEDSAPRRRRGATEDSPAPGAERRTVMMTDAELIALAAVVQAETAIALVANQDRARRDCAMAYGETWSPAHLDALIEEVDQRAAVRCVIRRREAGMGEP